MLGRKSQFIVVVLCSALCCTLFQTNAATLVRNGKSSSYILLSPDAGKVEKHAAKELSFFLKKQTGADVKIENKRVPGKTVIQFVSADDKNTVKDPAVNKAIQNIRHDGFIIHSGKDFVTIIAKEKRGFIYGAYRILTDFGDIYVNWQRKGAEVELTVRTSAKIQPITIEGYSVKGAELDEPKGYQKLILIKN